jgi:hypothetical protein
LSESEKEQVDEDYKDYLNKEGKRNIYRAYEVYNKVSERFAEILQNQTSDLSTRVVDSIHSKKRNISAYFEKLKEREKIANEDGITISYVGTGGVVELRYNDLLLDSAVIMIKGDIDGDGAVSSTDYLNIKSAFVGNISLEGVYFMAADIDENNTIDTTDYMRIKSYFFG